MFIFGTRPEAIKLAPVILAAESHNFKVNIVITNQHKDLVKPILKGFGLQHHHELSVAREALSQPMLLSKLAIELSEKIDRIKPDVCVVQGDTTSAFMGALIAFHHKVHIAHVEAGLRTYEKYSPFPEEINRKLITHITDMHFVPTKNSMENLLKEGIKKKNIVVSGNTVIDALLHVISRKNTFTDPSLNELLKTGEKLVLITSHRRESFGLPLKNIISAIKILSRKYKNYLFVYPVHPNPNVKIVVEKLLSGIKNVKLIDPVEYFDFCLLMSKAHIILTDSGGIQEEAPALNIPIIVLRDVTERPEVVEVGAAKLVGTDTNKIVNTFNHIADTPSVYRRMSSAKNPFGNGKSSQTIVKSLNKFLDTID
jgi:UDP-N-acetylglucosamine 2-epimerase (non-hydrolysing)